jgi:hypothetical protein
MPDDQILLEKSATSDKANLQGKECVLGVFLTEADGWKIVEATSKWEGTPYKSVGGESVNGVGGDCSGITNKSYIEAGFPYPFQPTRTFAAYAKSSNRFREINPKKVPMQAGDLLLWPGHMAIYAPFPEGHPKRDTGVMHHGKKQLNDFYTAFNKNTDVPYKAYNISTFRQDDYTVYRYLIVKGPEACK